MGLTKDASAAALAKACRLDVVAFKPGNVSLLSSGHGMEADDFLVSAKYAVPVLCAPGASVGHRIEQAAVATKSHVGCNTNLGIILLLGPLAVAAERARRWTELRTDLRGVLTDATVADAEHCFRAIQLARPAGIGSSENQDVHGRATLPLAEVMSLAADRDRIAAAYSSAYEEIFEFALPLLEVYRKRWHSLCWALTQVYLELVARAPDSHVWRKYGPEEAAQLSHQFAPVASALKACENPRRFLVRLQSLDQDLKTRGINPGTCADLTVATAAVFLLKRRLS